MPSLTIAQMRRIVWRRRVNAARAWRDLERRTAAGRVFDLVEEQQPDEDDRGDDR